MLSKRFLELGEYGAAGMYEEAGRSLFYRKALGIRRFYENCALSEYRGERLYPSGAFCTDMAVKPDYLKGMSMDYEAVAAKDKRAADAFVRDFERYRSSVPEEHTVAGNMWTHSMPNYGRILKEGLLSYIPRIEKIRNADLREGLLHIIEGIRNYQQRSVRYLLSVKADGRLVAALEKVPLEPAGSLYEAVVGWNFILYLDNCDNLGCVASGLFPYYRGEDATELLKNLYDNLDANNGYSMALGMDYNPLTLQCLEASKGKRRPMIELFVDEHTPGEIWDKAFEVIRTANGQPAFYNPDILLNGLRERITGITQEDIKKFCGGGCTEAMLAGLSHVGSLDAGIHLPLILEKTMRAQLLSSKSFEAFYDAYIAAVSQAVVQVTDEISNSQRSRAMYNPVPMRTLLIDDCIDRETEYNAGGARYRWSIINFAGMINVIDSLLVIRDFVFENAWYTPGEFLRKLAANDKAFLKRARGHCVSYGNDNEDVNRFSKEFSTVVFSMLEDKTPYLGGAFLPASIQFMSQAEAGRGVGATPDGRESGSPLCDSLAAVFGKDTKGPTALLKSAASLDQARALGVPVLNFNIAPGFKNEVLKALILGYMKLGGVQMQITCISEERLEEAYRNPDLHRNLVVRVGGYSEYFCRLSDELKRMVIERTIQKEV